MIFWVYSHSEENAIIRHCQHGFVCRSRLSSLIEVVMKMFDEGGAGVVVHIDFNNELDKIPHCRLIQKIKMHSAPGDLVIWIQNWFVLKIQRVVMEG